MLRLFGAARLSLVTYLLPVTALIYGALILDEPLRPSMLGGLAPDPRRGRARLGRRGGRCGRPVAEPAP